MSNIILFHRSVAVPNYRNQITFYVCVVRSCAHLQVLELERITDIGLRAVTELCEVGLNNLTTLVLTHTPVSGKAILHFHSETRTHTQKHTQPMRTTMASVGDHLCLCRCVPQSQVYYCEGVTIRLL